MEAPSPDICYYKKVGKVTTSWTDSNPERRFIGCEHYGQPGACGYFIWFDPPMCDRAKVVIPGLLWSLGRHETKKIRADAKIKRLRKMNNVLFAALVATWCLFVPYALMVWLNK
ncbi:hypothetical protein RHMOL_Rhmol08G0177100 [Rhododendron molle]|uniref:Uncharacterized protein n=1 Tax=Rhododendron molle TaxID=49168 RepID=A0ACC0MPH8_RHOML|nr:hypothetical protein RHMOL_Rhmol08G0177100 [Rhododendron molle]